MNLLPGGFVLGLPTAGPESGCALRPGMRFGLPALTQPYNLIMKIRVLLFALSALALAPVVTLRAADEDQTELGAKMEKMGGAWRKIKGQISDASKNDDTLAKLGVMKENMNAAMGLEPEKAKTMSGADKDKFIADYKAKMKEEIGKIDNLIALVKAGKNDEAAKLVGTVDQDQKDAHKAFKKGKKK